MIVPKKLQIISQILIPVSSPLAFREENISLALNSIIPQFSSATNSPMFYFSSRPSGHQTSNYADFRPKTAPVPRGALPKYNLPQIPDSLNVKKPAYLPDTADLSVYGDIYGNYPTPTDNKRPSLNDQGNLFQQQPRAPRPGKFSVSTNQENPFKTNNIGVIRGSQEHFSQTPQSQPYLSSLPNSNSTKPSQKSERNSNFFSQSADDYPKKDRKGPIPEIYLADKIVGPIAPLELARAVATGDLEKVKKLIEEFKPHAPLLTQLKHKQKTFRSKTKGDLFTTFTASRYNPAHWCVRFSDFFHTSDSVTEPEIPQPDPVKTQNSKDPETKGENSEDNDDIDTAEDTPISLLHIATIYNQTEIIKFLVETSEVDPTIPMAKAHRHQTILNIAFIKDMTTPLATAARLGHIESLKMLLELGASIICGNRGFNARSNALRTAVMFNQVESIRILLKHMGKLVETHNIPPLDDSLLSDQKYMETRCQIGNDHITLDVDALRYKTGINASLTLTAAAKYASIEVIFLLLKAGAQPWAADTSGYNAFHQAIRHNRPDVIELILSTLLHHKFTDPADDYEERHNKSSQLIEKYENLFQEFCLQFPVDDTYFAGFASLSPQTSILDFLRISTRILKGPHRKFSKKGNKTVNRYKDTQFNPMLLAGQYCPKALQIFHGDFGLNVKKIYFPAEETVLYAACRNGNHVSISTILQLFPPSENLDSFINSKNSHHDAPLHVAASANMLKLTRSQFETDPRDPPNIEDDDQDDIAEELSFQSLPPEFNLKPQSFPNGFTPTEEDFLKCVQILIKAGANWKMTGYMDQTALHASVFTDRVSCIDNLVKCAIIPTEDIDISPPPRLMSPLHTAVVKDCSNSARYLLERGGNPFLEERNGLTPFHMAVHRGSIACVKVFIDHISKTSGNDRVKELVNTLSAKADSPLFLICSNVSDNAEIVQILLENGADPFQTSSRGEYSLHATVRFNNKHILQTILNYKPEEYLAKHLSVKTRGTKNLEELLKRRGDAKLNAIYESTIKKHKSLLSEASPSPSSDDDANKAEPESEHTV